MHFAVILSLLVALTAAVPYPQEEGQPTDQVSEEPDLASSTVPGPQTTSWEFPITDILTATRSRNSHWEPIPIFTKECKCALETARYPCWATDSLQRCHFEENFSYGCYMSAAGGCPTPTRVCSNLFSPTPLSGRHPCELGSNPPPVTSAPGIISTPVATWPSANLTLTHLPSANTIQPTVNPGLRRMVKRP
ncbi:hypothetical protein ACN47E_007520 [Coniothyrium glycines]